MSHLYEELAKRKALIEKVNKLQSEVDQLDTQKAVPEKTSFSSSTSSTSVSPSINTAISTMPSALITKAVTTSSPSDASSQNKPLGSLTSGPSPSPSAVSKSSAVTSPAVPSMTFAKSQSYPTQCSTQPQISNAFHPLVQSVSVPVQMVTYVDRDGRLVATAPKSKQTSQKRNRSKKKPQTTSQSKQEVLPSATVPLSQKTMNTAVSPATPAGSVKQSLSVSHPFQPLVTSPVTPVNTPTRPKNDLLSPVSLVTSPVTPTPVRQVTPMTSLAAPGSEVPPMVSFAQNGLSFISPLSPLSTMSVAMSRPPTSRVTPLSSLSASTEKYLNTFATQMASATARPSFSSTSQSPCVSTNQFSYAGRTPFPNTDLSTDHSAGIKLLCDLLNDTLPEQPPSLLATSQAVRSQGTPSSEASPSSIPDTSRAEQRRHMDSPPTPPRKSASKSPRTPPMGNASVSPFPGGVTSSVEQPTSAQRTPARSATPPTGRKRTSPFTIDSLVSSTPETQTSKNKSPSDADMDKRHPSPVATNRSSPKGRNKSPSTNFSIAHITRDMNSPNPTSKTRVPFVTSPASYSLPTSVSSSEVNQNQRRISPPLSRLPYPETDQSFRVESSGTSSSNMGQNSAGSDRKGRLLAPVLTAPDTHSVPSAGTPTEMVAQAHVESSVVSDTVSRSAPLHGTKTDSSPKEGPVDTQKADLSVGYQRSSNKEMPLTNRASVICNNESVSGEVTSSISSVEKISSSISPGRGDASPTEALSTTFIPEIPLDMIPLPSGKRPSPKKRKSPTSVTDRKGSSPVHQAPKPGSPDSEVSSLMAHESLPQSPSISSSVSKAGSAVLEGQAPVLVDSNPCSARSPIPVAPSPRLQSHSGVSLPSFGSVFSPAKEGVPVTKEKNR